MASLRALSPPFARPRSASGILVGIARGTGGFKSPAHSATSVFVDKGVVGYHSSSVTIELKGHFVNAELSHGFTNASLMFFLTIEQQKATAAGAGNLASERPILAC